MAKVTLKDRKEKLAAFLAEKEGETITPELVAEAMSKLGGNGPVSTKTNEAGEVFCSYFQKYLPKEDFNENGKGKIDSMSKEGKKLFRTQKSMVNKAHSEVIAQFRKKEITAEEMESLLAKIEANATHRFPAGTEAIPEDYPFAV